MAILDANGVPILNLNNSSQEFVDGKHQAYLESGEDHHLYTGEVVYLHNPRPVGSDKEDVTIFHIGGETLDEAIKSVVGAFDGFYGHLPPTWVSSTNEDLAGLIAEHYGAEVKPITTEEEVAS